MGTMCPMRHENGRDYIVSARPKLEYLWLWRSNPIAPGDPHGLSWRTFSLDWAAFLEAEFEKWTEEGRQHPRSMKDTVQFGRYVMDFRRMSLCLERDEGYRRPVQRVAMCDTPSWWLEDEVTNRRVVCDVPATQVLEIEYVMGDHNLFPVELLGETWMVNLFSMTASRCNARMLLRRLGLALAYDCEPADPYRHNLLQERAVFETVDPTTRVKFAIPCLDREGTPYQGIDGLTDHIQPCCVEEVPQLSVQAPLCPLRTCVPTTLQHVWSFKHPCPHTRERCSELARTAPARHALHSLLYTHHLVRHSTKLQFDRLNERVESVLVITRQFKLFFESNAFVLFSGMPDVCVRCARISMSSTEGAWLCSLLGSRAYSWLLSMSDRLMVQRLQHSQRHEQCRLALLDVIRELCEGEDTVEMCMTTAVDRSRVADVVMGTPARLDCQTMCFFTSMADAVASVPSFFDDVLPDGSKRWALLVAGVVPGSLATVGSRETAAAMMTPPLRTVNATRQSDKLRVTFFHSCQCDSGGSQLWLYDHLRWSPMYLIGPARE